MRDALIIDPLTVPKQFEEAGITSEVMANRVGAALTQIEIATQTRMKKDRLAFHGEEASVPDVEIPGTTVGLKTVVEIIRTVFGIYPERISGDIVVPVHASPSAVSSQARQQAKVTIYLRVGRSRSVPVSVVGSAADVEMLVQRTAEAVLGQVNPYVLAAYREEHHQYEDAIEIVKRMIQDSSVGRRYKESAYIVWGNALAGQKRYDDAVAKYQKAIELDPKDPLAYNNWGIVLYGQKRYDDAVAKYQKAIELDPKDPRAYNYWGVVLNDQKRYDDAVAKYQKAIELDPKDPRAYNDWGVVLYGQKRYDDAVAKYQKAIELDPTYAFAYNNWGLVLNDQKRYDDAVAKYQKATELDPTYAVAYDNWGLMLYDQKRYDDAVAKYQKATELDPTFAVAYDNWGLALSEQGKYEEAIAKFNKAKELAGAR
jgi:tetratricopeptide (TPR) repeat protein